MSIIEYRLKPRVIWGRIAWLLALGLGLGAGGLLILLRFLADPDTDLATLTGVWLGGAVIAVVSIIDALRVISLRGAALRLDADGIWDRRIQRRPMKWREIDRVEALSLRRDPEIIGIWGRDAVGSRRALPLFNYFGLVFLLEHLARPFKFAPISVDLGSLDEDPEVIIAQVAARWGPLERRRLQTDGPPARS